MRAISLQIFAVALGWGALACSESGSADDAADAGGSGGASSGGSLGTGGTASGGAGTGGAAAGGTGGAASGGASTGGGSSIDCDGPALTGGTDYCSSTQGKLANGVSYSTWLSDATTGTNCGTFFNVDAAFKASWSMGSGGDFLARAGLEWDKTKTYDQLGTLSADYAYKKTGVTGTTAFIGIYGWSSSPLVEFYIVEEWIGWNPASNATKKGSITIDGEGTYDIYTHTQTNQPSIEGTQTFPQFFSIRTSTRECGHISISKHFKAWADAGMTLGKMYEAKLLVEAMGGSGVIDFTTAKVTAE